MKRFLKSMMCVLIAGILVFGFVPACFAMASDDSDALNDPVHNYLEDKAIAGYKYSAEDDYYYCDSPNSWQKTFGYSRIYDLVAPYVLLEYDYARVHFNYEGQNWLIQLWKGQYGLMFYGSEVGVYTKTAIEDNDTYVTHYDCASESDWLEIQTTMYHDANGDGTYIREFSTPTEKTWWSTGFKRGHLRQEEPAVELRQTGSITLKNEEMAQAFSTAFEECGFRRVYSENELTLDTFILDGATVRYIWQNNTEAENTMPIKMAAGTILFLHFSTVMTLILAVVAGFMAMGMLSLFLLILI